VPVIGEFGVLGVPSSAAAHGPGQEKAPAALRRAGLPERLAAAGVRFVDYGDLPVVRWRPDPHQRRPHNLKAVLDVLEETSGRVREILADGRVPLVLGGECSVTIAVVAAFRGADIEPALLYMDGGVDLFTPATNPTGIVDSMAVAHLLDEPGTSAELAGLGPARPLLRDDRLVLFGFTDYPGAEHDVLVRRDLAGLPAERIRGRPRQAAEEALARVRASADRFLLHFDVDVVDFLDLPVADIPLHNAGLSFDEAMSCLAVFARDEGLAGLTITEFNPDHGAEDGSTADALVAAWSARSPGDARQVSHRAGHGRRGWPGPGRARPGPARRPRRPRSGPGGPVRRTGPGAAPAGSPRPASWRWSGPRRGRSGWSRPGPGSGRGW
jgi:arginase